MSRCRAVAVLRAAVALHVSPFPGALHSATQVAHLGFSVEQAVKSANDLEQMAFARARDFTSYIQTVSDTLSKVKENRWRNTREKFGADLVGCIQLVEQVPYAAIGLTREDVLTWSTSLAKMVRATAQRAANKKARPARG